MDIFIISARNFQSTKLKENFIIMEQIRISGKTLKSILLTRQIHELTTKEALLFAIIPKKQRNFY